MPEEQPGTDPFREHDDPFRRARWFYSSRLDAQGNIPAGLIARASAQRHRLMRESLTLVAPGAPGTVNWTPLGPSVIAHEPGTGSPLANGRFTALAVGPGGQRIYAGAANGGVWFSSDRGTSWEPLDDYSTSLGPFKGIEADSLSVGALAVQFGGKREEDRVFVGTGEPQTGTDVPRAGSRVGGAYFGIGVRVSERGGVAGSWATEASEQLAGHGIFKLILDPDEPRVPGGPNIVYAATSIGLFQRDINHNWRQLRDSTFTNVDGAVSDMIVAGKGRTKRYYAAFWGDKVYVSNSGDWLGNWIWTPIPGLDLTENGRIVLTEKSGRIVLATSEEDPSVIYALCDNGNLYRMDNRARFELVSGVPKALFAQGQGWFDNVLAVDPQDHYTVYLGGDAIESNQTYDLSLYKGRLTPEPGGRTYHFPFDPAHDLSNGDSSNVPSDPTWIGLGIHPDIHTLAFATNADGTHDGSIVWLGTDGGLFASTESGKRGSFQPRNISEAAVQMTYLAQRLDTDAVLIGGCQDNGVLRYWGEQAWYEVFEGDGGGVAIDPHDPSRILYQSTDARLKRSKMDGREFERLKFPPTTNAQQQHLASAEADATGFYSPIALPPVGSPAPTLAAFGTNRLWLTRDWGTTWMTLPTGTNPYQLENNILEQDKLDDAPIRDIFFEQYRSIYVATAKGIWSFMQDSSTGVWRKTALPTTGLPPNHLITAVTADRTSVYITLGGGGSSNVPLSHVWHYELDDETATWRDANLAEGGKPIDVPAHAVVVDPSGNTTNDPSFRILYVGTDVGCWKGIKTQDASTKAWHWTWSLFSSGLPECAITDLVIHPAGLLRAATHGRGVWEIPLYEATGSPIDIYMRANYADSGRMKGGARFPWVTGEQGGTPVLDPRTYGYFFLWDSADIKVRPASVPPGSLPPLDHPNYLDFATNIGESFHPQNANLMLADASGPNQVFIQVHNRGLSPIAGERVRVLLLLARSLEMPENYASHINAQDTTTAWLGSSWYFAVPPSLNPYRVLPGTLDVRTPQVVKYEIDFSTLGIPLDPLILYLVAFVTTTDTTDQVTSTSMNLWDAIMHDKHIVYRRIWLM